MSSPEVFTPVDLAKRGYKILVILYDQSGVGSSVTAESFLSSCYCFTNKKDHVYDMAMSDITKKHHGNTIAYNIQQAVSPIIIDNVTDLPSAKLLCEFAVKHGYLIDIIQSKNASLPTKTREDLFIDFELLYEQEIPQLRRYPSIPSHLKSQDDTIIKGVIQTRYAPWILKNPKEPIKKNVNQEQQEKQTSLPDDATVSTTNDNNYGKETYQAFTKSLREDINRKFEGIEQTLTKTFKMFNDDQSKTLSNNAHDTNKKYEEVNSAVMKKIEEQIEILSKRVVTQLTAFIESSQNDMNKRLDENNSMMKKMENVIKEMKASTESEMKSLSNRIEEQQHMNKKLDEYDEKITKKVENILTEMKAYSAKEIEMLLKRLEMKLSQDILKSILNKNDNSPMKRMEDVTEMKTRNKNQEEILSERVDKKLTAFMKSSQDGVQRKLEENNGMITKGMRDLVTEMRTYNENQTEMLLKSIKQKIMTNTIASSRIQFSNDQAVEREQETNAKSSNKDVNTQGAKKRLLQTQNAFLKETQVNNNEYQRIISYVKAGLKVMILIRGLPGSGKSYLANKLLKDSLGTVNKSEFIFDPLEHLFQYGDLEAAHLWNKRQCFEAVKSGVNPVIVDSNNLQIEDMRIYCLMAVQMGYVIETIEVNTPWALNVSALTKKNTLHLNREQIQEMLESYQKNISLDYLLKELGISYK